ncbi:MFS transporter, partial [Streptomyces sp. 2MCAF27]
SLVARQSAPEDQDRNFGHFTIGASLGQLIGPIAAGQVVSEHADALARTSAAALFVSAVVATFAVTSLWRIEHRTPAADRTPAGASGRSEGGGARSGRVSVAGILRTRGVASGIFISLAVLSATDILTAYLPVVGEQRSIAPAVIGLLLSVRAAATVACRLVMTPMIRLVGRTVLM